MTREFSENNNHKSEFFEGSIKKIIIESEVFESPHPECDLVKKQRLTMHLYDKASLTTYYFPSESQKLKIMKRYRFKYTDKLMYYIAEYFRKPYSFDNNSQHGCWNIQLTNENDEKWAFSGPLGEQLFVYDFELSNLTRKTLVLPFLLMFDGKGNDVVLLSSTKNYNIYVDREFTSSDNDIGLPYYYVEVKSTNNYYICDLDFTRAYHRYTYDHLMTEQELERIIQNYTEFD